MDARVGYDIGNLACLGEGGCGLEKTDLVVPFGDVALDELGASRWYCQYYGYPKYQPELCTYLLSSCSNFLPFSTSGSPMQTLALFSILLLANACLPRNNGMLIYHTLQPPERGHKPLLDHLHLLNVIECSLN